MNGIAIYVEGGGEHEHQKAELRQGMDVLLATQKGLARDKRLSWKVVFCGGRDAAYHAFVNASNVEPTTLNVLLVDSEEGVASETGDKARNAKERIDHLLKRDRWDFLQTLPERVHLMVQCMETWIVADEDILEQFYGQHFARNALPERKNLEEESKADISVKLNRATHDPRMTKGAYKKIGHASKLLALIRPAKVAERCPRFLSLTSWLDQAIGSI